MSEVFRIIDRFKITGRGIVYTVEIPKGFTVCVGDILFDLRGNRFKVKGIEMFRRIPDGKSIEDMPVGPVSYLNYLIKLKLLEILW